MHKGMPTFKWGPGIEVMDTFEGEEDQTLFSQEVAEGNTVAQDVNLEIENQANNQLGDT